MKNTLLSFAIILVLCSPAMAEDEESGGLLPSEEELQELGRMAEGWMQEFADKIAPMVNRLNALIDDIDAYESPEMLPNGDIIIRRKPTPQEDLSKPDEDEAIDL